MTVAAADMAQYEGQKVVVEHELDEPAEDGSTTATTEGKADVANPTGLLLKPKGKSGLVLLSLDKIVSISYAPEKAKKISVKKVKIIGYGGVRQHLADRHGYTVADLENVAEESALQLHNDLDHEAEGVAHKHVDKDADSE
jgi:hypothetical protein